jgi:hypothetical protein
MRRGVRLVSGNVCPQYTCTCCYETLPAISKWIYSRPGKDNIYGLIGNQEAGSTSL